MVARTKQREEDIHIIVEDFKSFRKSGELLSSHHRRMISKYPEQWVAVYDGSVRACDKHYDALLSKMDRKEIPRNLTIIRYITKKPKSMIL